MSDKLNKNAIYASILAKIKEYNKIIIHHHVRPDGDCIGSQMGLKYILQASFPQKTILACGGDVPPYLQYIANHDTVTDEDYKDALVIVVDTSNPDRIFDKRFSTGKELIVIDHHDDFNPIGTINYVDETCSACAGIITDFYLLNKDELVITSEAAKCLYFGIVTDTGRFRYRGVDHELMEHAGYLLESGVDIDDLYAHLYTSNVQSLKVTGFVLRKFRSTKNGVLYMNWTRPRMRRFGIDAETAGNTVNNLDCVRGSIIWVCFIKQKNGEIRVRIRSRFVPINDIASKFRGGGHLCAAGATLYKRKEINQILKCLDERIREYRYAHPEVF